MYHLLVHKGALDRMEVFRRSQTFYGCDFAILYRRNRRATGEPDSTIDEDAARTALSQAASGLGTF
jgi:hypothetical protein